ncbi:hypothetical protein CsSME_00031314 [Camellia sinensis var. sinensis]
MEKLTRHKYPEKAEVTHNKQDILNSYQDFCSDTNCRCQGLRPTHTLYGHQYYECIGCLCLHGHCMSMETLATLTCFGSVLAPKPLDGSVNYRFEKYECFGKVLVKCEWTLFLQVMRQRRIDRGALTLASAEVKFQIDTETHDPLDIGMLT